MPAKATLFNSKCEAIYDFGTGARNECFFNPLGNNILSLFFSELNIYILT
jgi:translation initiation factor 2A